MQDKPASLYTRLGGYDAIAAVVDDLLPRLRSDELLSRFWVSPRSVDTHNRERQLAVDFIAAAAGGPTFYLGRDMKASGACRRRPRARGSASASGQAQSAVEP